MCLYSLCCVSLVLWLSWVVEVSECSSGGDTGVCVWPCMMSDASVCMFFEHVYEEYRYVYDSEHVYVQCMCVCMILNILCNAEQAAWGCITYTYNDSQDTRIQCEYIYISKSTFCWQGAIVCTDCTLIVQGTICAIVC